MIVSFVRRCSAAPLTLPQTNARLLKYADPTSNDWNTTSNGATIQTAIDFLMTTNPAATNEVNVTAEIYPNIAAVASVYGDPSGKYVSFLNASGFPYGEDATFLWDQPLKGGTVRAAPMSAGQGTSSNSTSTTPATTPANGAGSLGLHLWTLTLLALGWLAAL
jgi:hypothetical protein